MVTKNTWVENGLQKYIKLLSKMNRRRKNYSKKLNDSL